VNDVDRLILEAWEKLGPGIMEDPEELHRRLARRRSALLTRPPRAWCLCLRASDRRITAMDWILTPMHAMDLNHPEHPYEPIEHTVTIHVHGLRKFCRPVRTDSRGELVEDVAKNLGAPRKAPLLRARSSGLFTERRIRGLAGRHGRYPVPLIHSWQALDPSGPVFRKPDVLWGSLWEFLPDMVPDDFEQTILRKPTFTRWGAARGSHRNNAPPDHLYTDDVRFNGWRWICPSCKQQVHKIYYPIAPQTLFDYLGYDPARSKTAQAQSNEYLPCDVDDVPTPPACFACVTCHRVNGLERTTSAGWNTIVSWLSRGMLYGHEVQKPSWYRHQRKIARHRKLGRPAHKRDAVFNRLRLGWTVPQIALNMKISRKAAEYLIYKICKLEGVKNRHALAAKLRWTHPQPLNHWETDSQIAREREKLIEPLLLEGLIYPEIAKRLQIAEYNVANAAARIYRSHGISCRKAFMQKFAPATP
jgi:DNA-binding NarL/FixJ family response regulator